MKKQRSSIIGSVDELSQALGDSYVLFIGSAVSGRMPPYLPMVDDFRDGVLEGLSGSLSGDHYYEALLKKYSESLINGHHQHVARQTKFEEFLWFIQTLAGKDKLDDLLFRLYVCSSEECGPNQVAIATLLNSSKCAACFTTNFDNTIELVCPEIRTYIFSEDHPHSFPQVLPKRGAPPIIVKLHGDARAKNCVAISPQLYRDAREQIHSYLPALLDGHRVFVLGYSGLGDIGSVQK